MDQYIGKMLDNRYEILELIGSGGMANVYKAKCHRLNRLVAIKILKNELADNTEFRRRFRDESRAVAQLSHANIVSVYDVSTSGDTEYIVMELIDGITLKQYMERRGRMDWREAMHFITQIMRALSHAHSRGIIHRDIKPQNIMVLRDGSVKVADFGIACLENEGQTLTQEALGSVHYISPEQARGDRIDARSDIYSAGVVLYEMLTGRLPFEGDSAVSVAIQHLSSVPLPPRDINPDIPEALELICMKAMSPNADKRYPTADAILEDLERFRKDPDVDLDYIRADLCEAADSEPTQPISVAEVTAAHGLKKAAAAGKAKSAADEETEEKKSEKKKMAIIIGVFAAVLLIAFLIFQVVGSINKNPGTESHTVPGVLGYTVEQAEQLDGVKDVFTIEVIGTRADSKYQPGQIVEQALLAAMRPGCRLVMVGDPDQLPSVGAGNVFGDLIRSGVVPSVALTEIFRQAQQSAIIRNAHAVNEGRAPDLKGNQGDFFFLCRRAPDRLVQTVVELCKTRLPENMGIPADQIQVLTPTRRGETGTVAVNRALQAALNPPARGKRQKNWGDTVFREGDRVMQTKNNYDVIWEKDDGTTGTGIFNGDVGIIQEIDPSGELITIRFDDRTTVYTADLLGQLDIAYAVTVHKAQGSEYRAVVLLSAPAAASLMVRGVLYTALTRARELLILVGDDGIPGRMAANDRKARRYSGLRRRLKEGADT